MYNVQSSYQSCNQQTANELLGEPSKVASLLYDVKAQKNTACPLQHHWLVKIMIKNSILNYPNRGH